MSRYPGSKRKFEGICKIYLIIYPKKCVSLISSGAREFPSALELIGATFQMRRYQHNKLGHGFGPLKFLLLL